MTCEEARELLAAGSEDPAAELHVAVCATCFEWLEDRDPLVLSLRAARPEPALPPAFLAARVLAAWRRRGDLPHAGLAVALSALALGLLALAASTLGAPLLAVGLSVVSPLTALPLTLLEVGQGILLANPAWLSALVVLASGLCLVWLRWFQRLSSTAVSA